MNGLTLLIIGVPAALAVFAAKKHEHELKSGKQSKKTPDWAFPKKWHPPVAKTEGR